jgi:Outer membrane protein beta-barrel domain
MTIRHRLFSVALVLTVAMVPAITHAVPTAGSNEIEGAAGFFHAQGSSTGAFNADVHYGYYLSPGWEVGLRQALNYNFVDGARDRWVATTTPFIDYNFHLSDRVLPFLGLSGGVAWNDEHTTGTLGPNAGIKVFLSDQTYLGIRYRYEWFFHSFRGLERNADHGDHVATIGIGYVWGGSGKP